MFIMDFLPNRMTGSTNNAHIIAHIINSVFPHMCEATLSAGVQSLSFSGSSPDRFAVWPDA